MKIQSLTALFVLLIVAGCSPEVLTPQPEAAPVVETEPSDIVPEVAEFPPSDEPRPPHYRVTDELEAGYLYRAEIQTPADAVWGPDNHLYLADTNGRRIVRVAHDGTISDPGFWQEDPDIWRNTGPHSVDFGPDGTLYTSTHNAVYAITPAGEIQQLLGFQARLIADVVMGPDGSLYYSDREDGVIRRWIPSAAGKSGTSETVATGIPLADFMAFGPDGMLYVTQMNNSSIFQVNVTSGEVDQIVTGDDFANCEVFITFDQDGDIWLRGEFFLIRYTIEGQEKPYTVTGRTYDPRWEDLRTSAGIAVDDMGNLWIASYAAGLLQLTPGPDGFSLSAIYEGFEPSDMDILPDGSVVVFNMATSELWQISPEGDITVLIETSSSGVVAVAANSAGEVYLGLASGGIIRIEDDGTATTIAPILVNRMIFAEDGALYAAYNPPGQDRIIYRITGPDEYEPFLTTLEGAPIDRYTGLVAAPGGLYVSQVGKNTLHFVDFNGEDEVVFNLGNKTFSTCPIVALPGGGILFLAQRTYNIYRADASGEVSEFIYDVSGDPWGMVASPDGQWLYVAEVGAIDRISHSGD